MKKILTTFFTFTLLFTGDSAFAKDAGIRLERFESPFCMIGSGNSKVRFKKKLSILKRYQRKISRKVSAFRPNKKKERGATLIGSPKWITYKYLAHRKYTRREIQFAFFAMTLFGEARNLDELSMEMVARVINNRRKNKNYADTVTNLAQFSTWYYKNQKDNVVILCPNKNQTKNWKKAVKVAYKHFNKKDEVLGSTHYFSPYNMSPRFSAPNWSKGKYAVSYGGHIFLVKKNKYKGKKKIVFLPKKLKKVKSRRGKIII